MRKTIHTAEGRRLGQLVRSLRAEQKLTQRQLGDLVGWRHTVVHKIETAERRIDLVELDTLCEAMGTDLESFIRRYRQTARQDSATRR